MKILIPVDFSENSIKALELALGLNRNQKATIILVHIIELVYDFASQAALALDSLHKDANKLMDDLEEKYKADHLKFQKIIEEGTASISIARIASENKVNVIVIGTSGASGLKKLVVGSTTINLLKETSTPVLVVPSEANLSEVKKLTLAIQYSNHEKSLLDQIIIFKRNWELDIDFLHVSASDEFIDELAGLGLVTYLKNHFELDAPKVISLNSSSTNKGINTYLETNRKNILIMCHQHKSFWKEFQESSHSLAIAYQSTVPILVMN